MKKFLILEDKEEVRKLLAKLVEEVAQEVVVYETPDEKSAYEIAMTKDVDVFVVDMILHPERMGDVSGGEFVKNIRQVERYRFSPILVITSMYDPKMWMYSQFHCYQYIEKPFEPEKVKQIFREVLAYRQEKPQKEAAIFRVEGMLEMIPVTTIIYAESLGHRLRMVTTEKELQIPYKTCGQLMEQLDSQDFVRCRRGTIVNIRYVEKVDLVNRFIHLTEGQGTLEIGPRVKKEFLQKMLEWGKDMTT